MSDDGSSSPRGQDRDNAFSDDGEPSGHDSGAENSSSATTPAAPPALTTPGAQRRNKSEKNLPAAKAGHSKKGAKGKCPPGMKWCRGHCKFHAMADFAAGQSVCTAVYNANRALSATAKAQGQTDKWKDIFCDDAKYTKAISNYLRIVGDTLTGRAKTIKTQCFWLQYMEEERTVSSVDLEGSQQMMNLRQYKVWLAKPKNGSVEPEEAAIRFENLCKAPGAIIDEKGDCPKYRQRVAVHKGDFIVHRNQPFRVNP